MARQAQLLGRQWTSSFKKLGTFSYEPCKETVAKDFQLIIRKHVDLNAKLPMVQIPEKTSFEHLKPDFRSQMFPNQPDSNLFFEVAKHIHSSSREEDFKVIANSHALLALSGFSKFHWTVNATIRPRTVFLDLHLAGEKKYRDFNSVGKQFKLAWGCSVDPIYSINETQLDKYSIFIGSETDGTYNGGNCAIKLSQDSPEKVILPKNDWSISRAQMNAILENTQYFGFGQWEERKEKILVENLLVIEAEIMEWSENAEQPLTRLLENLKKLEGVPVGDYQMFGTKRTLDKIYAI